MTDLNNDAGRFFTFLGLLFLTASVASSMLNLVGCLAPNKAIGKQKFFVLLFYFIIFLFFYFF